MDGNIDTRSPAAHLRFRSCEVCEVTETQRSFHRGMWERSDRDIE